MNDDDGEVAVVEKGPERETGEHAATAVGDSRGDGSGIIDTASELEEKEAHSHTHSANGQDDDGSQSDTMTSGDETDEDDDGESVADDLLAMVPVRSCTLCSLLESFCGRRCTLA